LLLQSVRLDSITAQLSANRCPNGGGCHFLPMGLGCGLNLLVVVEQMIDFSVPATLVALVYRRRQQSKSGVYAICTTQQASRHVYLLVPDTESTESRIRAQVSKAIKGLKQN
jgi:hypothetical protein